MFNNAKLKNALILAAGKGLRMQNKFSCSKPMTPILGKPLVTFAIDSLIHCGIENISIVYNSSTSDVLELTKNNKKYFETINFIEDKEQRGVLSSINCANKIGLPFVMADADSIAQKADFWEMLNYGLELKKENPDLIIQTANNPSVVAERPLTVNNGRIINWNVNAKGYKTKAGGHIYIWYKTPFPLIYKLISDGIYDISVFLQCFIKKHKVLEMPIKDMWDVDTPEAVIQTENILRNSTSFR
jgi:dTDP-glucose pyrophosphorylase